MFDDVAIDVGYVESAVRTDYHCDWTKPIVGGGEEFAILLFGRAMAFEGDAVAFENFAMDQIEGRVGNENAAGEFGAEEFVAIGGGAVGGAGGVAFADVVEALLGFASGIEVVVCRRVDAELGDAQIRISFDVTRREIVMPEPI